jgi:cobalamin biosynthesis protein CobT
MGFLSRLFGTEKTTPKEAIKGTKSPLCVENEILKDLSGHVEYNDQLTCFIYLLMRDHLTPGDIQQILSESIHQEGEFSNTFTNGYLAKYAHHVALRLQSDQKVVTNEEDSEAKDEEDSEESDEDTEEDNEDTEEDETDSDEDDEELDNNPYKDDPDARCKCSECGRMCAPDTDNCPNCD